MKLEDREKDLVAELAKLPRQLQDRFLAELHGAAVALDCLAGETDRKSA